MKPFDAVPRNEMMEGFSFIGLATRTDNASEMKGEGVIPSINERFFRERLGESITGRKDSAVFALYTDYESDELGSYEYAVGVKTDGKSDVPDGMKRIEVPAQEYAVFTTRRGPLHEVVVEAWQSIWKWSKNNQRAFGVDFERYDERSLNPADAQADIYISVK